MLAADRVESVGFLIKLSRRESLVRLHKPLQAAAVVQKPMPCVFQKQSLAYRAVEAVMVCNA